MTRNWEPGTQYNYGDVVSYEGHNYKIIQPHFSQGDWNPAVTPALWGRMQDGGHHEQPHQQGGGGGYSSGYQQQQPQQVPQQQQGGYGGGYGDNKQDQQNQPNQESGTPKEEKKWYQESSNQMLAGGILAGAAALAAGGMYYKHTRDEKEEKVKHQHSFEEWCNEGRARTEEFHRGGPRGPLTWLQVRQGQSLPQNLIAGGEENGRPIWICRAFHEGSVQVGKCLPNGVGIIGYGHKEIQPEVFEVLVGDQRAIRWVPAEGRLDLDELRGCRPMEAGYEESGTALYVAQARYKDSIHPGKISTKLKAAFIPYGNDEEEVKEYRVLCYA
jgi:hypothetical protein